MKGRVSFVALAILMSFVLGTAIAKEVSGISSEQALKKLTDGNKRYVDARLAHPNQTADRRGEVAKAQHPFAIIVGCSDSRVPPEVIFD